MITITKEQVEAAFVSQVAHTKVKSNKTRKNSKAKQNADKKSTNQMIRKYQR